MSKKEKEFVPFPIPVSGIPEEARVSISYPFIDLEFMFNVIQAITELVAREELKNKREVAIKVSLEAVDPLTEEIIISAKPIFGLRYTGE